jgi:hypothetical protein
MSMRFIAMVSSDWNECLAPCRPFDFITFNYPKFETQLSHIFRLYTGNRIPLADAIRRIEKMLPQPITADQMDAYLVESFATYTGVPELIDWCLTHSILFMINTTGMIGYFQRAFAGNLLPRVPVISAHPMIRYSNHGSPRPIIYGLKDIQDKSRNTAAVAREYGIAPNRIVLMGDSGGDGPHFEWGARNGAFLVGCQTKPSLSDYCRNAGIRIDLEFGVEDPRKNDSDTRDVFQIDYRKLVPVIENIANR